MIAKNKTNRQIHKHNRNLATTSMGMFKKILIDSYKKTGDEVQLIDRYARTTGICSKCGYDVGKLDTSIRKWKCPNCNTVHDRDFCAAEVILHLGNNLETDNL